MKQRNANRPGYKHTKVGWIPEEWCDAQFGTIARFRNGLNFLKSHRGCKCRIIGVSSFQDYFEPQPDSFEEVELESQPTNEDLLTENDLLFVRSNGNKALIGRCLFMSHLHGQVSFSGFTIRARVFAKGVLPIYVALFFRTRGARREILALGGGTNISNLSQSILGVVRIPLPPLPEQERIAEVLSAWDGAIALTGQLIAAKQRLKKGLMQQLLTARLRFPEFGKPAQRRDKLPKGWKRVRLKEVAQVNPSPVKPDHNDCRVTFLAMADISEQGRIASRQERPYLSVSNGFTSFRDGDILVAKITPCFENGKGAYLEGLTNGIGFGSTEFHVVRARNADARFLFLHTQSRPFRGRGEANMTGSAGQKRVPADVVRDHPIPLPELEEQRRIAATMSACDREIHLLARKRDCLQEQKKGLMQRLLTGEVRVRVNPPSRGGSK
jgi:type I restriction enzyme S subunit